MTATTRITRRGFLRRSGAAAGAAGAPWFVPAAALGAEEKPAASERVTIGLIGCGGRGSAVFRGLIAAGGQAIAACDPWKDRREGWAKRIGGTAYADFREMLQRDDLDA
ncbi:MAG: NAD(P)-binding domain-containing protein, partial [Pirellulales bacterium]